MTPRPLPDIGESSCPKIATRTGRPPLRDAVRARFAESIRRLAERSGAPDAIELWRAAPAQDACDERSHRSLIVALRSERRLGEARNAYQGYVAAMDDLGVPHASWDEFAP